MQNKTSAAGTELKAKMIVTIRWPDGSTSKVKVISVMETDFCARLHDPIAKRYNGPDIYVLKTAIVSK